MKTIKTDDEKYLIYCKGCDHLHGFDGRWTFNGDTNKPTFSPSLLITKPYYGKIQNYVCHSFVTDGKMQYLNDCSHSLAGQTVELLNEEDWFEDN